jgi:hypothetical protein
MRWGALWRQYNSLDGYRSHIIHRELMPVLFITRREARAWIAKEYGYLKTRPDLREEPHGWKMPIPVQVEVVICKA